MEPTPKAPYDFAAFERRWQGYWKEKGTFRALPPFLR
jgi:hypothetical protein